MNRRVCTFPGMAVLLICLLIGYPTSGQQTASIQKARDFVQAGEYEQAVEVFRSVLGEDSLNGGAWYGLAGAYHQLERFKDAVAAYQQAELLNYRLTFTYYNMACAYNRGGDTFATLDALTTGSRGGLFKCSVIGRGSGFG